MLHILIETGACLSKLPNPPTQSPTGPDGLAVYYPDYSMAWSIGICKNDRPQPNGYPTYDTELECCKASYEGQASAACLNNLPNPPTGSPTGPDLDVYYPDTSLGWPEGTCTNARPLPNNVRTFPTMLDCCKGSFAGQVSAACLGNLPNPPTASPSETGPLGVYYADYKLPWPSGKCINDRPLPSGRPTYGTQEVCCISAYGGQQSDVCMCDANPCHSCKCPGIGDGTGNGCSLECAQGPSGEVSYADESTNKKSSKAEKRQSFQR